jgi:hypothetical protein
MAAGDRGVRAALPVELARTRSRRFNSKPERYIMYKNTYVYRGS